MKNKIYISGKITGCDPSEVIKKFNQAKEHIAALGHIPISPLDNGLLTDATWKEHLIKDIKILIECDSVYALIDNKESKGARLELHIARELGMLIIEQTEF